MRLLLFTLTALLSWQAAANSGHQQFFDHLKKHCGKTYFGETIFPDDPGDAFAGKTLVMHIKSCTDSQIKIPFKVGDDSSRTWILTLTDAGLLFKHDHRHEDGTPHELTMYGGYANSMGTEFSQYFPADKETHQLVPEGKTNVWQLTIDPANNQFIYYLERHSKPRYKAVFHLR